MQRTIENYQGQGANSKWVTDLSTKPKIFKVCTIVVNWLKNQQKETICRGKPQVRRIPKQGAWDKAEAKSGSQFWECLGALPIIRHEANIIMNLNMHRSQEL